MSTPVMPISLIIYKMVREYEETNRTKYPVGELYNFAHKALQIASEIDGEEYWILSVDKAEINFHQKMSKICDLSVGHFEINVEKYNNGGKAYADKVIGAMPYSFLKGAVKVLEEDLKQQEETKGIVCD